MKNYLNTLLFFLCAFSAMAQAPQKFNYQAVARNAQGAILPNQNVKIRASILDGSANGTSQYTETHSATTSQLGLFNLAIGGGTLVSGNFSTVTWTNGNKFLKIEMDATGGNNFSLVGTSQLLSVPYALNAGNGSQWKDGVNGIRYDEGHVYVNEQEPPHGLYTFAVTNDTVGNTNMVTRFFNPKHGTSYTNLRFATPRYHMETAVGTNLNSPWEIGLFQGFDQTQDRLFIGQSAQSEFISIKNNGNIGINSPNPNAKLEIVGDYDAVNNFTPTFRIGGPGGANSISTNSPMVFNIPSSAGYGFVFRNTDFDNLTNYTDLVRITPNGRLGIGKFLGFFDPSPLAELHVNDGDIFIDNPAKGVIMKSPNGQCWRMTVSNTGQPVFTSITCP